MAKEDFCFTYYDGDAARDKAHMTRLCRGAYDDLISMQRKVGHMDLDTIQMVLSSDFDSCWKSLLFILKKDLEGKYFIEWVDKSLQKMKENAAKQRERVSKRWEREKQSGITTVSKNDTTVSKNEDLVIPKIEDVNVNGYKDKDRGVGKGEGFFLDEKPMKDLTVLQVSNVKTFIYSVLQKKITDEDVKRYWEAFKIDNSKKHEWYGSDEKLLSHFRHSVKNELNKKNGISTNKQTGQANAIANAIQVGKDEFAAYRKESS